ncbi:MAG: LysR family transcriptional regulator [Rhodobacteraceae bacterium]|nr:LysR family transcriptional regulator [Paracoccaceae bacterium]
MKNYIRSLRPVQLRLISQIAQLGKLGLAANACHMTVPTASRMLSDLETNLGTALFERTAKGMRPSHLGRVLVRHANLISHEFDRMAQDFTMHQDGSGGVVSVGAVTGGALSVVIPAALKMKESSPGIEVSLDVSSSSRLMWGLDRGAYDFALCRLDTESASRDFEVTRAREERVLLMVNRDHPLRDRKNCSLGELAKFPWTMQDRGAPIRHAVEISFFDAGIELPTNVIETSSVVAIMALLRTSNIVAVVTQEVASLLLTPPFSADLYLIDMQTQIFIEPYHVVKPRGRIMSAAAEHLLELIKAHFSDN